MTVGNTENQIFRITDKMKKIQLHVSLHKKDNDAKRQLLRRVYKIRSLKKYNERLVAKKIKKEANTLFLKKVTEIS
jgi:ribosomal protein S15P/S13E